MPNSLNFLAAARSLTVVLGVLASPGAARAADGQTIAMIRHGEKPPQGLGQLNCQGLNRALALPPVVGKLIGTPAAIFAPDPAHQKEDGGRLYDYVRPLATVEPTAVALGLPVQTRFAVGDIAGLQKAVEQPAYRQAIVLVAWEHHEIEDLARALMAAHGGNPASVPKWQGDDFDSIYIVRLAWSGKTARASFERRQQGLDGQPAACPK